MKPDEFYADLHVHPMIRPSTLREISSPWTDYDEEETPERRYHRRARISRSDFSKAFQGGVRLLGTYLIVPERYIYSKMLTSPSVLARYFNMDVEAIREILCTRPFKLLKKEFKSLKESLEDPNSERSAVIIRNKKELETTLADPNKLALVLGVEGAHNLDLEYEGPDFPVEGKLYNFKNKVETAEPKSFELVEKRVRWLKKNHVKLFTLNHFVFNHLASMPKAAELTGWKKIGHNPFKSLWQLGNYRGLTHLGQYFVEECMKAGIVLDLKHCDAISRAQIYRLAQRYDMPVIGSHVAVSGRATNVNGNSLLQMEDFPADRKKASKFNPWDINFHDDDIVAVHRSGGLLGLILDERVLASVESQKKLTKLEKPGDSTALLFAQIEHIYKTLRKAGVPGPACFDSICIGSDYDGFIEPLPNVPTLADLRHRPEEHGENRSQLDVTLLELLQKHAHTFRASKLQPAEIVNKIFRENQMRLYQRVFQ